MVQSLVWAALAAGHAHAHARAMSACAGEPAAAAAAAAGEPAISDARFVAYLLAAAALVVVSGLMSGLTLALMSVDEVGLEVLRRGGTRRQRAAAARVAPLLADLGPHRVLVALLLCNAAAAEALPLFLDRLADPVTAVVGSVLAMLIFGEVLPQAACAGERGLAVGAASARAVRALVFATAPVNAPVAWALDAALGRRAAAAPRRAQLRALVDLAAEGGAGGARLGPGEAAAVRGALDLARKRAAARMTPLAQAFTLRPDARLDEAGLTALLASGHSRVPILAPGARRVVAGALLVKELLLLDPRAGATVADAKVRPLPRLPADTPMYDVLKVFELGRAHMAVLTAPTAAAVAARRAAAAAARPDFDAASGGEDAGDAAERGSLLSGSAASEDGAVHGRAASFSSDGSAAARGGGWAPGDVEDVGIITVEDVLEELLNVDLQDETDRGGAPGYGPASLGALPPHLARALGLGGSGAAAAAREPWRGALPAAPARRAAADGVGGARDPFAGLPRALRPASAAPRSVAGQLGVDGASRRRSLEQEVRGLLAPLVTAASGDEED
jgi:metal transporter CNNM